MRRFNGVPYPIRKTPKGYLYSQSGTNQIKSDLLVLLMTNPNERVMLPAYGTPLRQLVFEPNDSRLQLAAKNMIINSIKMWEPRIVVQNITVENSLNTDDAARGDDRTEFENCLLIKIIFVDPQNIKEVLDLVVEVPLSK
jgi:phage baseplate assembly protein W